MPQVAIFGKKDCKMCEACKDKMRIMKVPYQFVDLMSPEEGWRNTSAVDARVEYEMMETGKEVLPIVEVNGKFMTYEASMKTIKDILNVRKEKANVIQLPTPAHAELELAEVAMG